MLEVAPWDRVQACLCMCSAPGRSLSTEGSNRHQGADLQDHRFSWSIVRMSEHSALCMHSNIDSVTQRSLETTSLAQDG